MAIPHIGNYRKLIRDVEGDPKLKKELERNPKEVLKRYARNPAEKAKISRMKKIKVVFDDGNVKHVVIPKVRSGGEVGFVCC